MSKYAFIVELFRTVYVLSAFFFLRWTGCTFLIKLIQVTHIASIE